MRYYGISEKLYPKFANKNMPKAFRPQIVSGNLLKSGESVYRLNDGSYGTDFRLAAVAHDEEALQQWLKDAEENLLIGAYGIVVELENSVPEPVHFRERIRILGPTFNNKQNLDQQWHQAREQQFSNLVSVNSVHY